MFQESLVFSPAGSIYDMQLHQKLCEKVDNSTTKYATELLMYLQGPHTFLQLFFEEPMPTVRLSEENSVWLSISGIFYSIK